MAVPLFYSNFQAGLNTKSAPYLLDEGLGPLPSRDLSNVVSTLSGSVQKRNGLVTFASPASVMSSLFPFEVASPLLLVGAAGSTLVSVSTGGVVTGIASGLTPNQRWELVSSNVVSGQGPLYGMNGVDTPQQWSGAGSTAPWTNASGAKPVPNGKYCIYHNNQVFVAGVAGAPSTVYWSALLGSGGADPTNWDDGSFTGAGAFPFEANDGQPITGLGTVGPYVLVFKPRKTWVIVDTGSGTFRQISDSVGCVAHRSIQSASEGTYFLSEDRGVYVTDGTTLKPISDQIQPTLDAVGSQNANAVGAYFNAHYYLSIAANGSPPNDTTLDYDTALNSWWRHSFGSNQFAVWHPSGVAQLYSAKATAAIVDQCFAPGALLDNGSQFTWVWRGPWQSPSFYRRRLFPTPYYRKRLRQVRWDGNGTVDLSIAKDFALTESLVRANSFGAGLVGGTWGGAGAWGGADPALWGGAALINRQRANSLGVANAFSVVFSATSPTADSVDSYLLVMHDRSDGVPV